VLDEVVEPDPLQLFAAWFQAAGEEQEHPEFVALATASAGGSPSVRMVELQSFDERGFVFYTGADSRKGRELAENPQAALCFYWHGAHHQVRVEGAVERTRLDANEAEVAARAAQAPRQDEPLSGRAELEARVAAVRARYGDGQPPLPSDWAAYRLVPEEYEFWQYRADRLHDRFRYRLVDCGRWEVQRLFP
jgi:pyridoxamine 5'-phosphate oxidase